MPAPVAQPPLRLHPKVPEWFPRSDHDGGDAQAQQNWEAFCKNAVEKFEEGAWKGFGDPPSDFESVRTEALRRLSMVQFAGLWSPDGEGGSPADNDPMSIFDLFRAWDFDRDTQDPEEARKVMKPMVGWVRERRIQEWRTKTK